MKQNLETPRVDSETAISVASGGSPYQTSPHTPDTWDEYVKSLSHDEYFGGHNNAPCRCGNKKHPLAMHCDACLIGRDKGRDYGDWSE